MSGEPVARPHPEPVVFDVGGGYGGLVVHWDVEHLDVPIEVSLTGQDADRQHQHVLERPLPGGAIAYAAAFAKLPVGSYTLWADGEARAREVLLRDGQVTELRWTRDLA